MSDQAVGNNELQLFLFYYCSKYNSHIAFSNILKHV